MLSNFPENEKLIEISKHFQLEGQARGPANAVIPVLMGALAAYGTYQTVQDVKQLKEKYDQLKVKDKTFNDFYQENKVDIIWTSADVLLTVVPVAAMVKGVDGAVDGLSVLKKASKNADEYKEVVQSFKDIGSKVVGGVSGSAIWTNTKSKSSVSNAFYHFQKHGREFPDVQNAKQYVDKALDFVKNPPGGTLTHIRKNGEVLRYNAEANAFSVTTKEGTLKTFYKPKRGIKYWEDEITK